MDSFVLLILYRGIVQTSRKKTDMKACGCGRCCRWMIFCVDFGILISTEFWIEYEGVNIGMCFYRVTVDPINDP